MDNFPTIELPLNHGAIFDTYEIEEELGFLRIGSPTSVYRARDTQTHQLVALKIFSLHYEHNYAVEHMFARFSREMEIMHQLRHPHILPILAAGHNAQSYWFVTPYCPLGTLEDHLENRQRAPLTVWSACTFAIQICEALQTLHTQSPPIIHRDVKPANMLFQDTGSLLLSDFGIAHILHQPHLTQHGKVFGTPAYMAPEQLRSRPKDDAEHIDARLDVYALGCVLYEMLNGQPPFTGMPEAVALAHLRVTPHPLHYLNGEVNQGLALIVQRAMEKDPADRFPSAEAFAAALQPFVED